MLIPLLHYYRILVQKIKAFQVSRRRRLFHFLHPNLTHLDVSGSPKLSSIVETEVLPDSSLKLPKLQELRTNQCCELTAIQVEAPRLVKIEARDNPKLSKMTIKGSYLAEIDLKGSPSLSVGQVFLHGPEFDSVLNQGFMDALVEFLEILLSSQSSQSSTLRLGDGLLAHLRGKLNGRYFPSSVYTLIHTFAFFDGGIWLGFGNSLGEAEVKALAAVLPSSKFTKLELPGCYIGDVGVKALAGALPLTMITELDLSGCQIGDAGAKALADALPLTTITNLNLMDNSIRYEGSNALAEVLRYTMIKNLNIQDNPFEDKGDPSNDADRYLRPLFSRWPFTGPKYRLNKNNETIVVTDFTINI